MSQKKYPPFSVLMSVYVKENPRYFDLSLISIEKQTILPDELVLVEDGPITSELVKVINEHKDFWGASLKIVKIPKNGGLGPALNVGTKYITTNWIARMDTDDISVPNRFELQLNEIIKDPDYAVIGGQVAEFNKNIIGFRKVPLTQDNIYKFIQYRNPFNHPTVMINKNKLISVGGYTKADKFEDYNLWVKFVSKKYKLKNIDSILVYMRSGESLYRRRGGLKYLREYINKKKDWKKEGIGNSFTVLISDVSMIINIILPVSLRKRLYQRVLHKGK